MDSLPLKSPQLDAFAAAFRAALAEPPADVDPWFFKYCGELAHDRELATYVRARKQMLELAGGVMGKDVLDAGSGFGATSHLLAAWGARNVYAVEIHGPMVETHGKVRRARFPDAHNVHLARCDVSALPLADRSVDLVLSIEAVSHYYDVPAFLDECRRVLRPGGKLVISDGNNGANPAIKAEVQELWKRMELGPHGRWMTHDVKETMHERRVRFFRENFPGIDDARANALAEITSGQAGDELRELGRRALAGEKIPESRWRAGTCPRDPHWGYWVEWLFDPRGLAMELECRGFDARALAHFAGGGNDLLLLANKVLRALLGFRHARAFRIVATRR
jgi:ubiquinone/menaquinone biosynthesis C-methylase UbiE